MNIRPSRGFANRSTLLVMVAALAAGLGLFTAQRHFGAAGISKAPPAVRAEQLKSVVLINPPRELAAYRLTSADGSALTPETLRGRWTVVFLGFTSCPDICPTTLTELSNAQKLWHELPERSRPRLLFVSVDPERDTPAITGEYTRNFHADTLAATAEPDALAQFTRALGLVYMKMPTEGDNYTVDHSAILVVLDPQGRQAGLIKPPLVWKDIEQDLRLLAGSAP